MFTCFDLIRSWHRLRADAQKIDPNLQYNIIVFTFLDSYRNKSGKPQPIQTKVGTHAKIKSRQRSWNFGRDRLSGSKMGGLKSVPDAGFFFVSNTRWLFGNFATADFRKIWPWDANRGWNADFGKKFRKSFHSGVMCPKTPNLEGVKQAPHSEKATGKKMHYRET